MSISQLLEGMHDRINKLTVDKMQLLCALKVVLNETHQKDGRISDEDRQAAQSIADKHDPFK